MTLIFSRKAYTTPYTSLHLGARSSKSESNFWMVKTYGWFQTSIYTNQNCCQQKSPHKRTHITNFMSETEASIERRICASMYIMFVHALITLSKASTTQNSFEWGDKMHAHGWIVQKGGLISWRRCQWGCFGQRAMCLDTSMLISAQPVILDFISQIFSYYPFTTTPFF